MEPIVLVAGSIAASGAFWATSRARRPCWERSDCLLRQTNQTACERCVVYAGHTLSQTIEPLPLVTIRPVAAATGSRA